MTQRVTSARFIGRRQQLAELERILSSEGDQLPALAFVSGESGVGKSRLLRELLATAEREGARAIGGACVELGDGELPYAPLVGALRPLQRADDEVLAELPAATRAELARLLPDLGEPPSDAEVERGEAQRRLFDAFLELIDRLSDAGPQGLLLWIEDIHWADRSTLSFLRFLAASLSEERVLVVATYRSDELHRRHPLRPVLAELERAPRARRLELERFDHGELGDQLADILGEAPDAEVIERVYGRSEGNPLFTEELVAAGRDGSAPLPPSLSEALLLRVERLPDETQRLLRLLAVAEVADGGLLAAASELGQDAVSAAIREAIAAQIVVTDAVERFGFRHALLREVLVDDLLPGERAELHLRLAEALEGVREAGGPVAATAIAHHYNAAGDQPRALASAIEAATAIRRLHAYGEAAVLLDRAIELWDRVPADRLPAGTDKAELLAQAGRANYLAGEDERGAAMYERAVAELDEATDAERVAALLSSLAAARWSLGQADLSVSIQERALGLVAADDDSEARAELLAQRVRFLMLRGRYSEVRDAADEALAAARRVGSEEAVAAVLNRLGCALIALGQEQEGRARLLEAIEVARRVGSNDHLATAYLNFADALNNNGYGAEARDVARQAEDELSEQVGPDANRYMRWVGLGLAEIEYDRGRWAEAEMHLRRSGLPPGGVGLAHARVLHARLALGHGDEGAAAEQLEHAESLLRDALEPQYIASLACEQVALARRTGDLAAARNAVDVGLDRIQYCSEDAARMARVAAAGVAVEADAAERGRDLGDEAMEVAAIERAEALAEIVRATAEEGGRPVELAYLALAEAEVRRAVGEDDPALWDAAIAAWGTVERPYPQAAARFRRAQAELAAGGRAEAARSLAATAAEADDIGATWLAGEVRGLATRARLSTAPADGVEAQDDGDEAPAPEPFGLTPRERQVLDLLASGATNREIGEQLFMAEKTASVHVSRILSKLDVRGRTEAAAVAHRLGLAPAAAEARGPAEDQEADGG